MSARACLQLREQVADVRLDRLLGEEEALADLAVHEALGDELQHLGLAHGRLELELPERPLERDDLGSAGPAAAAGGDFFEPARVIAVPAHDLAAFGCVHGPGIGVVMHRL